MAKNTHTKLYGAQTVINLGSALELNIPDPVDDRLVVSQESDIWNNAFQFDGAAAYIYHGMQVYAVDTKTTYMYIGPDRTGGPSKTDCQTKSNWRKVSSPDFSVDLIRDNFDKLAAAAGVSGTSSANTFGYSAHTTPTFISNQNPLSIQTEVVAIEKALTPTTNTCEKVTGTTSGDNSHKNIISITKDGIEAFADIHYDSTTNKLTFVNTNGKKDIELSGVNFISGANYNQTEEQIEIYYQKYGETSASTLTIPAKGIIEEYKFKHASSGGTEYNTSFTLTDHNVSLTCTRNEESSISGETLVYGDIDIFDCGTY